MLLPSNRPVFDANTSGGKDLGDLPEWDLTDLYLAPDAPELTRDLDWLDKACADFAKSYEGKLASLDAAAMRACIDAYEQIDITAGRIMSFAGLRYYQVTTDAERAKFMSDCQDRITNATTPLVFFSLEFNRIDDAAYEELFANEALNRFKPVFDRMRAMKPHQLSDKLEKFLHDQSVVGASAWNKLFDETMAGLEFDVNGETLGLEATLNFLTDQDRTKREAASHALSKVFADNIKLFSRITNTLAKEKSIEDGWRKMPSPQAGRHLANHVEPEVVEALRNAVVAAYPRLSHRYYELKRRWLGLDKMQVWDRNAPLPMETDRIVGWEEARKTVTDAYAAFSPELAQLTQPFFDKGWIDAGVKPGKAPGAFAHPTVTTVHPYVMLNYLGKPRDVMTLAHELGHGVHQVLAADQGEMLSSTPLTLAETASVFGEMLTFRKMLDGAKERLRTQDHAGRQGRGYDQHSRPPDRVLRFRMQAARRPCRRRTDPRCHQRPLDVCARRKPWLSVRVHGRIRDFLGLHPPLHPLTILCLRLCLRRRIGERALCGLRRRRAGLSGEIFRDAESWRIQAPQGTVGPLRPGRQRSGVLGQGSWHDRRLH